MYPLTFLPFVGTSYGKSNIFGKKIMVLGDCHYGSKPTPNVTNDIINSYLNLNIEREGWMNTYKKFERSLVNKETSLEDSQIIWDSLLFYNYVQKLISGPREAPTKEQYAESADAFIKVLEQYEPDVLIVWGRRLWSNLPHSNWEESGDVSVDNHIVNNGFYYLKNGHKVKVFGVDHPSSNYDWASWNKVVSYFLQIENVVTNTLSGIGFSNFRKFKQFPTIELGGVNIIVGANNAGKSTFDKATILFLDFIKKWLKGNSISIDFNSKLCRDLGINSYEEALNISADKERDSLCFTMTIGRYQYEAAFRPSNIEDSDKSVVSALYVKVVDNEDYNCEYLFNYESQNNATVKVVLPQFSPKSDGVDIIKRHLEDPLTALYLEDRFPIVKNEILAHLDTISKYIDTYTKKVIDAKTGRVAATTAAAAALTAMNPIGLVAVPIVMSLLGTSGKTDLNDAVKAFKQIKILLGDYIPKDFDVFEALEAAISQVARKTEKIHLNMYLSRSSTLKDVFAKLARINALQPMLDEGRGNNPLVVEINMCPIITLSQKKTFSTYDPDYTSQNNSVSRAVIGFVNSISNYLSKKDEYSYLLGEDGIETPVVNFLIKWMRELKLGSNLRFRSLYNEVYAMDIETLEGHWLPLTSVGMGSVHLCVLLLSIANFIMSSGTLVKQVLIVEEPEINLHPNRQSQLADFFMDIYHTFGIQVVAETHSEYLVRRLQVLAAKRINNGGEYMSVVNKEIKVYYFPQDNGPYSLAFRENGHFKERFGSGFFDEAGKACLELYKI